VIVAERDPVLRRLVGFGRFLRSRGFAVGTGRILSFVQAATFLGPTKPDEVRLAARMTLVSRHEDFEALDEAFDAYFFRGARAAEDGDPVSSRASRGPDSEELLQPEGVPSAQWRGSAGEGEEAEGEAAIRILASGVEVLRRKDFAELSEEERRLTARLIQALSPVVPLRRSRRTRVGDGRRFDLRGTLRQAMRTEGEPFRRVWRERRTRQRPMVLLLDVSGSMAAYSRPLMEFAHVLTLTQRRVEVFCFGTRLTRVTREVRRRDPAHALAAVGRAVIDWEGGTRIGESLKQLLDEWSSRSALRGAVVILCSDGLERGEPDVLRSQMERLSRLAHRLIWVNPLKGSPRYEPLARGMAASLPYVDVFLSGHNLESLEALAAAVAAA
jgi:uncharacterized protein with von Willebrand factor type A (vWA) domain